MNAPSNVTVGSLASRLAEGGPLGGRRRSEWRLQATLPIVLFCWRLAATAVALTLDKNDDPGDKPEGIGGNSQEGETILKNGQQHDAQDCSG